MARSRWYLWRKATRVQAAPLGDSLEARPAVCRGPGRPPTRSRCGCRACRRRDWRSRCRASRRHWRRSRPRCARVVKDRPSAPAAPATRRTIAASSRDVEPLVLPLDLDLHARLVLPVAPGGPVAGRRLLEAAPHVLGLGLELLDARGSASRRAPSRAAGTMLVASPPWMTPRFAVVSASTRPSFMPAMASRGDLDRADIPRSGQMPAWASRPCTVKDRRLAAGARVISSQTPSTSSTSPRFARSRPVSKCLAPSSPYSSQMLSTTSMSPCGMLRSRRTRMASKIATMPALSSPPSTRGAVGADDVALDHRVDRLRRPHRVHVGREEEGRRPGLVAGEAREEIAGLAADLLPRVVHLDAGAHALENALEPPRDGALAPGQAGDRRPARGTRP